MMQPVSSSFSLDLSLIFSSIRVMNMIIVIVVGMSSLVGIGFDFDVGVEVSGNVEVLIFLKIPHKPKYRMFEIIKGV